MNDIEQLKASKYIKNHSLIIAGAGCGKTTTLLKKVDYLIENKIKPQEILVISFTNETVNNFKAKCKYNIDVFTFHKLALNICNSEKEICDENIITEIAENIIKNLPKNLFKKICKIYNSKSNLNVVVDQLTSICKIIKTNEVNINKLPSKKFSKKEILILYICNKIINKYNNELENNGFIDFDDMIINATNKLNKNIIKHTYKHILVDEYQDISKIRLNFLKALIKNNNSILTAVGDDWQSIYGFSGSNIKLFSEFNKYFNNSKIFKIETSYRCPKKIIKISEKFIKKNKYQIGKRLKTTNKYNCKYKKIYTCDYKKKFSELINKLLIKNKSVMILSRNNFDIYKYLYKKYKIIDSYLYINNIKIENIRFLTIHKSKGLESDVVIILNMKNDINGLPCLRKNILIDKLLNNKEPINYAEERRLMYVALTRAKEDLYILVDNKKPSKFVKEI